MTDIKNKAREFTLNRVDKFVVSKEQAIEKCLLEVKKGNNTLGYRSENVIFFWEEVEKQLYIMKNEL